MWVLFSTNRELLPILSSSWYFQSASSCSWPGPMFLHLLRTSSISLPSHRSNMKMGSPQIKLDSPIVGRVWMLSLTQNSLTWSPNWSLNSLLLSIKPLPNQALTWTGATLMLRDSKQSSTTLTTSFPRSRQPRRTSQRSMNRWSRRFRMSKNAPALTSLLISELIYF